MRLSISSLAWDTEENSAVASLLKDYDVTAVDLVPGKYFSDPTAASAQDVLNIKSWWTSYGIEIIGMQSLLFGAIGLNLFGDQDSQTAMLKRLDAVCMIGGVLGAQRLAFGSPKNRDRSGLSDAEALKKAVDFFYRLGGVAQKNGVIVCLEPNPICYASNFMTTTMETVEVVQAVNHPAIRLQLDVGAIMINSENLSSILSKHSNLVGHIHLSEPQLVPLGDSQVDHVKIAEVLTEYFPNHFLTIEMLATKNEPHLKAIERALKVAKVYANT